jgi:hypothetical protein
VSQCYEHVVCSQGYVQTSEQLSFLMRCMERRGVISRMTRPYAILSGKKLHGKWLLN